MGPPLPRCEKGSHCLVSCFRPFSISGLLSACVPPPPLCVLLRRRQEQQRRLRWFMDRLKSQAEKETQMSFLHLERERGRCMGDSAATRTASFSCLPLLPVSMRSLENKASTNKGVRSQGDHNGRLLILNEALIPSPCYPLNPEHVRYP